VLDAQSGGSREALRVLRRIRNDVTAIDLQNRGREFTRSKSFDTFAPLGPTIETCAFLRPDPPIIPWEIWPETREVIADKIVSTVVTLRRPVEKLPQLRTARHYERRGAKLTRAPVHDRMPTILDPGAVSEWIDDRTKVEDIRAFSGQRRKIYSWRKRSRRSSITSRTIAAMRGRGKPTSYFLPVPLSEIVSDGLEALLVTVRLPFRILVALGVNVTDILHFRPALSGPTHALGGAAKSPLARTPKTVIV